MNTQKMHPIEYEQRRFTLSLWSEITNQMCEICPSYKKCVTCLPNQEKCYYHSFYKKFKEIFIGKFEPEWIEFETEIMEGIVNSGNYD